MSENVKYLPSVVVSDLGNPALQRIHAFPNVSDMKDFIEAPGNSPYILSQTIVIYHLPDDNNEH